MNVHGLKNKYNENKIKNFCDNIITLITFSNDSQLYFLNVLDFKKQILSGGSTKFSGAANYLNTILNSVSKERSIRLLSFSDGKIFDINESMKSLNSILNSNKTKHQMNSVSVRVCHGTEPDTQILMKLSSFSHPICDMTQIVVNPEKDGVDEVVDKLYKLFINDGMIYNLKLYSDIILMSNDFSNNFYKEQYFNNNNTVFRVKDHRILSDYQKNLKISVGTLNIEDCGELKEEDFYNIIDKNAPYIAQRILERKTNVNNSSENKEIINYFKTTEDYFDIQRGNISNSENIIIEQKENTKHNKIYEIFQEINENNEIKSMNPNKLSEYIKEVRDKTFNIIKNKNNNDYPISSKESVLLINNKNKNKNGNIFEDNNKIETNFTKKINNIIHLSSNYLKNSNNQKLFKDIIDAYNINLNNNINNLESGENSPYINNTYLESENISKIKLPNAFRQKKNLYYIQPNINFTLNQ